MRIALISDLHGSELALNAVLADIARTGVDQIICLGDVATMGPRPREVLERLAELRCICILGNHDEFMLDERLIRSYSELPIIVEAVDWCRAQLSRAELDFIASFSRRFELELDGSGRLLLFHGTPHSNMTDLLATTPPELVDEMLGGRRATIMAGGHTHLQMLRQHRGTLLVNPGSVGLPFKEYASGKAPIVLPHAEYAVIEAMAGDLAVSLRRVALDKAELREATSAVAHPMRAWMMQMYA
ncbi:MAG TPA: metallophosphoesterase family protein [Polyangiaceae bacterium]|nr:metallophosphoesterase family protein [Polyangiaceae bacterium]